jgi:hypothetical protein
MRVAWQNHVKYGSKVFNDDDAVRRGMHETIAWIDATLAHVTGDALVHRELRHAGAMARHGARRVLGGEGLHAELDAIIDELVALWTVRNRQGGLKDSVAKLQASRAFIA